LLTAQPFDPADSPREHHHSQSPVKQQISMSLDVTESTTYKLHINMTTAVVLQNEYVLIRNHIKPSYRK